MYPHSHVRFIVSPGSESKPNENGLYLSFFCLCSPYRKHRGSSWIMPEGSERKRAHETDVTIALLEKGYAACQMRITFPSERSWIGSGVLPSRFEFAAHRSDIAVAALGPQVNYINPLPTESCYKITHVSSLICTPSASKVDILRL